MQYMCFEKRDAPKQTSARQEAGARPEITNPTDGYYFVENPVHK